MANFHVARELKTDRRGLKHGMSGFPEWSVWVDVRRRCQNPNYHGYKSYGARGVKLCKRWQKFENFYADMGPRPTAKHSIDRIDPSGDYTPKNCRWATWAEQCANKRSAHFIIWNGKRRRLKEVYTEIGCSLHYATVRARLRNSWPADQALTVPRGAYGYPRIGHTPQGVLS